MDRHKEDPSSRQAQHRLAYEVMYMVHGVLEADKVASQHSAFFNRKPYSAPQPPKESLHAVDKADLNSLVNRNAPQTSAETPFKHNLTLPRSLVENQPVPRILVAAGLVSSRSEGNRMMEAGGVYVGRQPGLGLGKDMRDSMEFIPCKDSRAELSWSYVIEDSLLILRTGKWRVRIIKIVPDEEFERLGLTAPGWEEWKARGTPGEVKAGEKADGGEPGKAAAAAN